MTVLNKGLSFCPTTPLDTFALEEDLTQFFRRLRLAAHFIETPYVCQETDTQTIPIFSITNLGLRTKSNFSPPRKYHPVEAYINLVQDLRNLLRDTHNGTLRHNHNLSSNKKQALTSLQNKKDIIIKPADKGGALGGAIMLQKITQPAGEFSEGRHRPNDQDPKTNLLG